MYFRHLTKYTAYTNITHFMALIMTTVGLVFHFHFQQDEGYYQASCPFSV